MKTQNLHSGNFTEVSHFISALYSSLLFQKGLEILNVASLQYTISILRVSHVSILAP